MKRIPDCRAIRARLAPLSVLLAGLAAAAAPVCGASPAYDPLRVAAGFSPERQELVVKDERLVREVPLRIYLPKERGPAPVVLFSHGLGGSRAGSEYLGVHWASRGYAAVFLQHPGSDEGVWKGRPAAERMAAMRRAASPENFQLRVRDVPAVLDGLARWSQTTGHPLSGRLDLTRIGMSGHSFGALTTQAVSGQRFLGSARFTDARIKAAVLMSPSGPRGGGDPRETFGEVKIPWMLLTGTQDRSPIGDADPESRRTVFPALPPGGKYELVLAGAEHSAFTETRLPGDTERRNPNHHRAILAVTTAFWDAYLREDADAKKWLDGDGARSVLEKEDLWQRK
jgi:predicted dienelactone hydrolase